jgi:hypothetical protein
LRLSASAKEGKAVEPMKIESILVTVLLAGGTNLVARVLTQGVELALVATAVEWSASRISAAVKLARSRR